MDYDYVFGQSNMSSFHGVKELAFSLGEYMTSDRLMIYRYIYFGKPLEIIGTLHYRTDGRLILPPRMCKQEITYLKGL